MKTTGKNRVLSGLRVICFYKAPFYLLYALTLVFVLFVFKLPDEESLKLLNLSFPVVGILAGISFSWAECLPEGAHRERALLASKRFFHSLIMLCLGIICKYITFAKIPGMAVPRAALFIMEILVYYSIGVAHLFFYAGLHVTGRNLWGNEMRGIVVEKGIPQNGAVDRQNRLLTLCLNAQSYIKKYAYAAFFDNMEYYDSNYASASGMTTRSPSNIAESSLKGETIPRG